MPPPPPPKRVWRNAQADLVRAERAYAAAIAPLGAAIITATRVLVTSQLRAIVGDPEDPDAGWRGRLDTALADAIARAWRAYPPRRAASVVSTQRELVDRLNLGNLTRQTRRGAKGAAQGEMLAAIEVADLRDVWRAWDDEQADMLTGSVRTHTDRVRARVVAGVVAGAAIVAIASMAGEVDGMTRRGLDNSAANATQSLNSRESETRWDEAGVRRYTWITVGDDRVRPEHAERHGVIYAWDDPPEDGHPGEPYMCRCEARPMIESFRSQAPHEGKPGREAELAAMAREHAGFSRKAVSGFRSAQLPVLERMIGERIQPVGAT